MSKAGQMVAAESVQRNPTQEVTFGQEAHKELLQGAEILYRAVKSTMGPSGLNVIIDNGQTAPLITKDGVTVAKSINLKDKLPSIGAELIKEVASKTNELAGDGPQPLYAKVLTPTGWATMGELHVGDSICGTGGTVQQVLGVFPKGNRDIYRVVLSDGNRKTKSRTVECCEDHLWNVTTNRGTSRLMTTKKLLENGAVNDKRGKFFIKPTPVEFSEQQLPLDPYLLGVLLGDGSLSQKHEVDISVGLKEDHILDRLILPEGCSLRRRYYTTAKHYIKATVTGSRRGGQQPVGTKSIIKKALEQLGLLGATSHTKFIPKQYLYSSVSSRQKLLEGLIDTDGSVNRRGLFQYNTTSDQLCQDVVELCRSLGKTINVRTHTRKHGDGSYSTRPIHRITELAGNKYGMRVVDIEKLNKQTEMMCIKVSNLDSLYITDDYVPTHNTTTATVLGYSMLHQGVKMVATGRSAISVKKGMEWATEQVIGWIKDHAISVRNDEDIINIGTISANGDRSIGELLCGAIKKVGQDGIITIEPAKSVKTTLDVVEGMQFESGYVSPYFVTNQEKLNCELTDPYVLITNKKINSLQEVLPVLELTANANRPLLIIADEIEGEALHTLLVNKMKGVLFSCAVKAPSYGENRADILSDISLVTGGKVFDASSEKQIKNATLSDLGECKRAIISKGSTTLVGDETSRKELVAERVEQLRTLLSANLGIDDLKRENTKRRLAKLAGGIAVIKVGGSTEVEIFEKKDRVEDALNATIAAVQEGILPGGGTALFYASEWLQKEMANNAENMSEDELAGARVIYEACRQPLRVIVENTGKSPDVVMNELRSYDNKKLVSLLHDIAGDTSRPEVVVEKKAETLLNQRLRQGYDASRHVYCDLIERGVIDPLKVERYALEHACSVVGLLLTTSCVIVVKNGE
jgi:chaperonin GroEL